MFAILGEFRIKMVNPYTEDEAEVKKLINCDIGTRFFYFNGDANVMRVAVICAFDGDQAYCVDVWHTDVNWCIYHEFEIPLTKTGPACTP